MKKHVLILILMIAMVNFLVITGYGGEKNKNKSRYVVVISHTPEQCLAQLDQISEKGEDLLSKFEWGCKSGNHTGWALIKSESEAGVKKMIPMGVQENMKLVAVNKFTKEDLEAIHKEMEK